VTFTTPMISVRFPSCNAREPISQSNTGRMEAILNL
jgi:hypothetical protein